MRNTDGIEATTCWDAGETGCGTLIVGLKRQIEAIAPGQLLQVTVSDAGAATDVPAWCRMTGHTLVSARPPVFLVRRKDD